MNTIDELLFVDFDGNEINSAGSVIYGGLDDARHTARVAPLTAILHDTAASPTVRFLACKTLTNWAEPAGYQAVIDATRNPRSTPWYDTSIDRKFSVDDTFAQLARAVKTSRLIAAQKGTYPQCIQALRALISIADTEYFDGELLFIPSRFGKPTVQELATDIHNVVNRGMDAFADGPHPRFDVESQLMDLCIVLLADSEPEAVDLATTLLRVFQQNVVLSPNVNSPRIIRLAVSIISEGKQQDSKDFATYLKFHADPQTRKEIDKALADRETPQNAS